MNRKTSRFHSNIYDNQLIFSTSVIQFHYQNADFTEIIAVAHIILPS